MTEAINAHKKMAMGMTEGNVMKKGGKVAKYAKGGAVMSEKKSHTLINDSSQKQPLPKPTGKIATMKKGGHAKSGLTVAVVMPMKKASARGR
jgi:hypothetical protein